MNKKDKILIMVDLITTAEKLRNIQGKADQVGRSMWSQEVESAVNAIFKDSACKLKTFKSISYDLSCYTDRTTDLQEYSAYENGINQAIGFLKAWKKEIELYHKDKVKQTITKEDKEVSHKCFIAHGHNDLIKHKVKDYVQNSLNIKPIVLHQEVNKGKTVVEKFEQHSDVDFALCIWSADDEGKPLEKGTLQKRARQNVVLETGFFWGKIGRENVIILLEDGVEIPSDFSGMLYIPMKDNWKDELRKEIMNMYKLDVQ